MGDWLQTLAKIHHYHYPVIGAVGLLWTAAVSEPGTHLFSVGPLRIDLFYVTVVSFGTLVILSAMDSFDPEEYELDSSESEK